MIQIATINRILESLASFPKNNGAYYGYGPLKVEMIDEAKDIITKNPEIGFKYGQPSVILHLLEPERFFGINVAEGEIDYELSRWWSEIKGREDDSEEPLFEKLHNEVSPLIEMFEYLRDQTTPRTRYYVIVEKDGPPNRGKRTYDSISRLPIDAHSPEEALKIGTNILKLFPREQRTHNRPYNPEMDADRFGMLDNPDPGTVFEIEVPRV